MSASPAKSGIKSRAVLKGYFKNGQVPDEDKFADLIDSMAHRADLPPPAPPPTPVPTPAPAPQPAPRPPREHGMPAGLRIGRFDPAGEHALRLLPASALLAHCRAPADGRWHPVLSGLNDCYAFEIVACASGLVSAGRHAVTHAIALTAFGADAGLRQTFSGAPAKRGWRLFACLRRRRPRVEFKWVASGAQVALQVRSNVNFGFDQEGAQVMIEYHVTRLW